MLTEFPPLYTDWLHPNFRTYLSHCDPAYRCRPRCCRKLPSLARCPEVAAQEERQEERSEKAQEVLYLDSENNAIYYTAFCTR